MRYNGVEMTTEEYVIKRRGFASFENAYEMMKWMEKKTCGFSQDGHKRSFTSYYISNYCGDKDYHLLTNSERELLKRYQGKLREEYEANKALFHGQFILETLQAEVEREKELNRRGLCRSYYEKIAQKNLDNFISGKKVPVYEDRHLSKGFETITTFYSDGTQEKAGYSTF